MANQYRQALVIGSLSAFAEAFANLEGRAFHFDYVADTRAASHYLLRQAADVVLLCLPREETLCQTALAWLRRAKEQFPVVVVSDEADIRPYLVAMESGAFDYLTSHTSLAEMERVLAGAVRWRQRQAA